MQKRTRLAIALRLYLAASGINQKELCEKLNINPASFSRFLNRLGTPEVESMLKLFSYLMENEQCQNVQNVE